MSIIEPVRRDIEQPGKIKKNSSALRFWHWANFIVITGSLVTVLINSTILDTHENASFIQSELVKAHAATTAVQARSVAHALEDKVWSVHAYFGYVLAALFLFRLLLEIFQVADQKIVRKIKQAHLDYYVLGKNRKIARHELVVKWLYVAFYLILLVMVCTGLTLAFADDLHIPRNIERPVHSIHSFGMYLVLAFIVVHLAGVFLAERGTEKGIVSDMINGGDRPANVPQA